MHTLTTAWTNGKEYRGEYQGSGRARNELQEQRDNKIVEIVDHLEVADHRLLAAGLGLEHTPSSLASIGRRMKRLKDDEVIQLVKQNNVTFAVTLDIPIKKKGEKAELSHRYMQARVWQCLEAVLPLEDRQTDRQWRAQGGLVIPDGSFRLANHGYLIETNGGRDHFETIVEKSRRYHRDQEYFCSLLGVDQITVLWVSKLPGRAVRMVRELAQVGKGGMFLIASDQDINPFDPLSILQCWRSAKTGELQSLIEEA